MCAPPVLGIDSTHYKNCEHALVYTQRAQFPQDTVGSNKVHITAVLG